MSEKIVAKHLGWAIVERSNSPYLTIVGWFDGRRHKESVKSHLVEAARALIKKRTGQLAKDGKLPPRAAERARFADLERLLLEHIERHGRPSYLATATHRLKFLRRAFGHERASEIRYGKLDRYVAARIEQGAAAATVAQELRLLHRAMVLAAQHELLEHVPPFPTVAGADTERENFAEPAEVEALLKALPEHVRPVALLLGWSGMRRGEALNLEWSRIDLERQEITLLASDTKTKRSRTFPYGLLPELVEMLERQRAKVSELERKRQCIITRVFPDVSLSTLLRHWRTAAKAIGRPELTRHDLRRSFARNAVRSGIHEDVVMRLAGWKRRDMLTRYNRSSSGDLIEGTAKLSAYVAGRLTAPPTAPRKDGTA